MKTKSLSTFLFFLCCSVNVFSQFIIAGTHGTNDYYHDIIPDTSVYATDPNGQPYYSFPSNTHDFLIDLNGDYINDFKLTAIYANGNQWYQRFYCTITPLNNNSVAVSQFDSCFNYLTPPVFQYLTPMAKSFSYNDSINKNSIWIDSTAYLAYNNNDANYIDCYNNSFTTNTEYVGLKILIPNDTLYGWIKVKAAKYDSMVVQEFACNLFSTNIATYQNKSSLEIYPNPSCGKFTVDNNDLKINNNDFEIYNVLGEKIYSARINTKKKEIDLLNKPKGLYFVKTVIENESVTKKIIIE